jgi:protein SCO1/2
MKPNLLLFASAAIAVAMATARGAEPVKNAAHSACCSGAATAACAFTDKSLYQSDSTWLDDSGRPLKLASLRGRPQVVCMFFANCQFACPLLVQQMKQIEAALPEALRTNTGFVLVSFDPERDTPAALHNYRLEHDLSADRWTLLHGSADNVLELAALLGVKFKKDAQGQFMHSNILTLLNSQGEIAFQETGLSLSSERFVERLKKGR